MVGQSIISHDDNTYPPVPVLQQVVHGKPSRLTVIDTHAWNSVIGLAIDCYERNVAILEDLDDISLGMETDRNEPVNRRTLDAAEQVTTCRREHGE
jgi:hypothetical protein